MENAQTGAQEFMSMSKKSIGTYFIGSLGNSIGSGLEFDEIDVLLPLLIDIPAGDSTFRPKVREFFSNIVTKIPFGTGKELEIGLTLSNDAPVTFTKVLVEGKPAVYNLPVNIQDYIRYRHALKHPLVAPSRAEAKANMLAEFYIFDQASVDSDVASARKVTDKAITTYLAISKDMEKVDAMLTLMGDDIRSYHGANAEDLKLEALHKFASTRAGDFNKVYEEKDFDLRFLLQKMINTGVVRKIGGVFSDKESGGILGHNNEEVILYLKDTSNADKVSFLKGKVQEAMKLKVAAKKLLKTTIRS